MSTTEAPSSWELARGQGESQRDSLEDYMRRIDAANHGEDDADDLEDIEQEIREEPLEMYATGKRQAGESEWTVDAVTVVLGIGGPHVELVYTDTDAARLHVYWGAEWSCSVDSDIAATLGSIWGVDLMFDGES